MAQHVSITLTDDVDGSKAAETVQFALDGAHYEIDLSSRNAKSIRKSLAEFVAAGRPVTPATLGVDPALGTARPRRPKAAPRTDKALLDAIRAWALQNKVPIARRGRIAADVRAQYEAATASPNQN